jgi:hypothetical protein
MHVEPANPPGPDMGGVWSAPNARPPPSQGPGKTEGRLGAASEPTHPFVRSETVQRVHQLAGNLQCGIYASLPCWSASPRLKIPSRDDKERSGESARARQTPRGGLHEAYPSKPSPTGKLAGSTDRRFRRVSLAPGLSLTAGSQASGLPKDGARGGGIGIGIYWHSCQSLVSRPGIWHLAVGRIRIDIPTN